MYLGNAGNLFRGKFGRAESGCALKLTYEQKAEGWLYVIAHVLFVAFTGWVFLSILRGGI